MTKMIKSLILEVMNNAQNFENNDFAERENLNELINYYNELYDLNMSKKSIYSHPEQEYSNGNFAYSRNNGISWKNYAHKQDPKNWSVLDTMCAELFSVEHLQDIATALELNKMKEWEEEARELAKLYHQEAEETVQYDHYIIHRVGAVVSVYDINDPTLQRDLNKELDEELESYANINRPTLDWWAWIHEMSVKYAHR